jgi:Icc-related predicted phosphoesterase
LKYLVTSDLHGKYEAYERFSSMLERDDYDAGIIAGDLLDDGVPDEELPEIFANTDLSPDDFLPELALETESRDEYMQRQIARLHSPYDPFVRANQYKEDKLRRILCRSGKSIFLVLGNHDLTPWADGACIVNLHMKRHKHGALNLVGYRWTAMERSPEDRAGDATELARLIDAKTILVTHDPPHGILDLGSYGFKEHTPLSNEYGPIGSHELRAMIDASRPMFHIFGHVHSQFGVEGNCINASYPYQRKFVSLDTDSGKIEFIETV